MKRLIYILSAITILVLSCTREIVPGYGEGDNCISLKISNSTLETKADRKGTDVENTINTLDFFFFPQGGTEENSSLYKRVIFPEGIKETADVHLYLTDAEFSLIYPSDNSNTSCVAFVIANLPDESLSAVGTTPKLQALKKINLAGDFIDANNNPITPTSFVMYGQVTLTREKNTDKKVDGEVVLLRAASKITLSVKLPGYILVPKTDANGNPSKDANGNIENVMWTPQFSDAGPEGGMGHTFVSLHNGVSADYLVDEYTPSSTDYFNTRKVGSFTYQSSSQLSGETSGGATVYTYTCDATFYSYSSEWNAGDVHSPCFILQIPWKNNSDNSYVTHYYQVQINSFGKELAPNHWYDLKLSVGVLGSTVETLPAEIQSCSYEVLNWSTIMTVFDRDEEEINLDEWQYLIIDESQVVMNNTTTGSFTYSASHPVRWSLEWPQLSELGEGPYNLIVNDFDAIERKYNTEKCAAYYLDCTKVDAEAKSLSSNDLINDNCFSAVDGLFTFSLPSRIADQSDLKIFTPVYVHVKVWLDILDNGDLDDEEKDYVYHLTFVYNPPMYIVPDPSTITSIYVNGIKHKTEHAGTDYNVTYGDHKLGNVAGIRDKGVTENYSMYVITVTTLDDNNNKFTGLKNNQFKGPTINSANGNVVTPIADNNIKTYTYVVGDPRQRYVENFDLDDDDDEYTYDGKTWKWTTPARYVYSDETNHTLTHYYPTASSGNSFQVIAPKFRIVSFNNASQKTTTPQGAAMRCASLQEDGFPAGRWRLPTIAEVQYVIGLQMQGVIQPIFYSTSSMYATALYTTADRDKIVTLSVGDNNKLIWNTPNEKISVRCVYDEWYWGSEREAIDDGGTGGNKYLFTWGDKKIY